MFVEPSGDAGSDEACSGDIASGDTTNSILRTAAPVYRLMTARYRGASVCNSSFHPLSATATESTPSAKRRACVRSATTDPHTIGHAIKGASAGGACRKERATILSNINPACSIIDSGSRRKCSTRISILAPPRVMLPASKAGTKNLRFAEHSRADPLRFEER